MPKATHNLRYKFLEDSLSVGRFGSGGCGAGDRCLCFQTNNAAEGKSVRIAGFLNREALVHERGVELGTMARREHETLFGYK